ncbi:hypothetical protein [Aquiflexum sp.]|uniref:hypothetical protein n=1 Tax=Aquiflexum sp. TaxID=1872584 RepID=UPI00359401B4
MYSDQRFDPVPFQPVNESARINSEIPYDMVLVSATYITAEESDEVGRTLIFTDRGNKQLIFDWAPNLRISGETDISYYIDRFRPAAPSGLTVNDTEPAIENAISTWENARCSNIGLNRIGNVPIAVGVVAAQFGFGGAAGYIADINHAGWMPPAFFDQIVPNGSRFILGVTFTFAFRDADGNFVDTNNDGKFDVSLREIYYNNRFLWTTTGNPGTADVQTIVLHEMGHGLSQEHFGAAFVARNGRLRFSPRAVMNASYSGVQRDLAGTDNAGHCSIWGNWPNN